MSGTANRCVQLRNALRVSQLALKLGHAPTAQEIMASLSLERRTAYRWAKSLRDVLEETTRPNGPRVFAEIEPA